MRSNKDSAYNQPRDDLFCEFCGKQWRTLNSLNNHRCRCQNNPNKKAAPVRRKRTGLPHEKLPIEIELDDDGKLYNKWRRKWDTDKYGLNKGFDLTFEQYCLLVKEAGLKSSQLGFNGDGYVLARYNDEGPYTWGNCRFITQKENLAERKVSKQMRIAPTLAENRKKISEGLKRHYEQLSQIHSNIS